VVLNHQAESVTGAVVVQHLKGSVRHFFVALSLSSAEMALEQFVTRSNHDQLRPMKSYLAL
jgi:hypothetical protein